MNWRQYQDEAASLFRAAGCEAKVEEIVEGVRGPHEIDVCVTFKQHGINCIWLVECKYWNRNVPKEKVMALSAIVSDCGADKGIIISKKGFQSGAVRAATKTNIILTSLEEYRCPDCGSEMVAREYIEYDEKNSGLVETFECGYQTGGHFGTCPCPFGALFPKIDDYELNNFTLEKEPTWKYHCHAMPKTEMARRVHLKEGHGRTADEAREAVIEHHEYLTTPPRQEFRGKWIQRSGYPKPT